jgi:hypothetical protein
MLIGASVVTSLQCYECPPLSTFIASLDSNQLTTYKAIVEQRQKLYVYGLLLGIVLATMLFILTGFNMHPVLSGCLYAFIILVTQYAFYLYSPKLPAMKDNLTSDAQLKLWSDVYLRMRKRLYAGIILGFLGFAAVPFVCKN